MKAIYTGTMLIVVLGFVALIFVLGWSSDCTKLNDLNRKSVDEYTETILKSDTSAMSDSQYTEYMDIMSEWGNRIDDSQSTWQSKCG